MSAIDLDAELDALIAAHPKHSAELLDAIIDAVLAAQYGGDN